VIRLLRFGLSTLALAYLGALVWYFTVLALEPGRTGWLGMARELTLYAFLPLPVLLLAALLLLARTALVLTLPPLLLFAYFYGPQLLPRHPPEAAGPQLRVLSFNTGGNAGGGQAPPVLRAVQAVGADLVALQEVPPVTVDALRTALAAEYPYSAGDSEALVLSRFPLQGLSGFQIPDGAYTSRQVEVQLGARRLTLTNVHVNRPAYWLRWRGGVLPVVRGYDPTRRDAQVAELVRYAQRAAGPHLLVGDFNATEWSTAYELLRAQFEDSFRAAGWGFGHTYPSHIVWGRWLVSVPLLRIDYVFYSPELVALRAYVGPDGGSDHLPVVAELSFR